MPEIHGNTEGVRTSVLKTLETLYDVTIDSEEYLPIELASVMGRYSCALNREISLYISRDGEIMDITIGDTGSVPLSGIRLRRSLKKLSRIRCIHTHPRGSAELSDVDLSALKSLMLDSMCSLGVDTEGHITGVQASFLHEKVNGEPIPVCTPIYSLKRLPQREWMNEILLSETRVQQGEDKDETDAPERAILVGIDTDESLNELQALAESAGAVVIGRSLQKKAHPDSATYVGSGKADELSLTAQAMEADVIIVDDELTGAQTHNLEDIIGVKVVDRTALILDIFAQRARTAEGRLQVSLAQLKYQSTRLIGQGLVLSRLAGGIGTRGPGESKLEMDRRRIRDRITQLRRELQELENQRMLRRKAREKNAIPVVALVGYTNTGKSTLLNRVSGADVYVQDRLFATLDATSRNVQLPDGGEYLMVDTVGFIRKLPTELVEAFHSTLEEAALADLLIIVNDFSSPDMLPQYEVVCQVLEQLGATSQPRIHVLNKCDAAPEEEFDPLPNAIRISAKTGEGLDTLTAAIAAALRQGERKVQVLVPFSDYNVVSEIRAQGRILNEDYTDNGTQVSCMLDEAAYGRLLSRYPHIFDPQ